MSVGQTLAAAREERRLSVEDISASTRIRASLIRHIEADEFDGCGGAVYARGHIRSIARVVGIDPGPLIAEFDEGHRSEAVPILASAVPAETDRAALASSERRGPNWAAAMAAALVVIIVVLAYGLTRGGSGPKSHNLAGGHNTIAATSPSTTPVTTHTGRPPKQPTAELNPNETIMLIRATQTTWVQVTNVSTGAVLFRDDLNPGQHKLFTAKAALDFVIGNAPGVDVVINGKDIGVPKSSGNVARGLVQPGSETIQQA